MKNLLIFLVLTMTSMVTAESIKVKIKGMTCESCVASITDNLKATQKCEGVKVSLSEKQATFETKKGVTLGDDEIKLAIKKAGYEASEISRQ
jgi:copper chaperone CopZ